MFVYLRFQTKKRGETQSKRFRVLTLVNSGKKKLNEKIEKKSREWKDTSVESLLGKKLINMDEQTLNKDRPNKMMKRKWNKVMECIDYDLVKPLEHVWAKT